MFCAAAWDIQVASSKARVGNALRYIGAARSDNDYFHASGLLEKRLFLSLNTLDQTHRTHNRMLSTTGGTAGFVLHIVSGHGVPAYFLYIYCISFWEVDEHLYILRRLSLVATLMNGLL